MADIAHPSRMMESDTGYFGGIHTRMAVSEDCEQITDLNNYWCDSESRGDSHSGFVRFRFSYAQMHELICNNLVVVGTSDGALVGYYLVCDRFYEDTIRIRSQMIAELMSNGTAPQGIYSYITQAAVSPNAQRRGIAKAMLHELKQALQSKYDYLASTISYQNENAMIAHQKSGWSVVQHLENSCLVITSTSTNISD